MSVTREPTSTSQNGAIPLQTDYLELSRQVGE